MKKSAVLFSALAFFAIGMAFPLFSQERIYSYEALRNSVYEKHPDLLKLQEEVLRSRLDVKDAKAGLGPVIDFQFSATFMANPPVDAIYLNVDDVINSINWPAAGSPSSTGQYIKLYDGMENTFYNFSIQMMQPVWTWGKLTNAISLYEKISEIKEIQLLSKQQEIETELETRLTTLCYLKEILFIIDEEKNYAQRMVKVSEDAEKSGMVLHQDVVDAKIQAKELDIARQDLVEQINNQLLELMRITGIDDLSFENLVLEYDEEKIASLLASDRKSIELMVLSEKQSSLKMLSLLKEVNELSVKIAKGYENWKPDIALQITAGYGGSRVPLLEPNWLRKDEYSANFSLGLKTTVWDGGKKLNDIARKESERSSADINKIDATSSIKKTLSSQWNTIDVCTMKIEYQDLKIEASESKIKQKETIYMTGYGSETDLLSEKINACNHRIEKQKQLLTRAVACNAIEFLRK